MAFPKDLTNCQSPLPHALACITHSQASRIPCLTHSSDSHTHIPTVSSVSCFHPCTVHTSPLPPPHTCPPLQLPPNHWLLTWPKHFNLRPARPPMSRPSPMFCLTICQHLSPFWFAVLLEHSITELRALILFLNHQNAPRLHPYIATGKMHALRIPDLISLLVQHRSLLNIFSLLWCHTRVS